MLRLGPSEAVLYRADRDGGADSDPTGTRQRVFKLYCYGGGLIRLIPRSWLARELSCINYYCQWP